MFKLLNKNIKLFYIINFFEALMFSIPIWLIFFTVYLNFSLGTALFVYVFAGLIAFIFEILSGSWADRLGRKKIYIIGLILSIIGQSFYLWADQIYLFIISSFILGISYAINSGNLEALIHDHLEQENKIEQYDNIQANQYIFLFSGKAIAALLGGYSYLLSEILPFLLNITAYTITLFLVLFLSNPIQKKSKEMTDIEHIKKGFNFLLLNKKYLYFIFLGGLIFTGFGNIYRFTYQEYLKEIGFHIKEYGIIYFIISLFSAIGSYLVKKIQGKYSSFSLLRFINVILFIVSILFIYFNNYLGVIPIFILSIIFGFIMVIGNNYLIKYSPLTHKSTILSIFSFCISLGYFIFSALTGFFIDIFDLETVYLYIPIILGLILLIDFIYFRKKYY